MYTFSSEEGNAVSRLKIDEVVRTTTGYAGGVCGAGTYQDGDYISTSCKSCSDAPSRPKCPDLYTVRSVCILFLVLPVLFSCVCMSQEVCVCVWGGASLFVPPCKRLQTRPARFRCPHTNQTALRPRMLLTWHLWVMHLLNAGFKVARTKLVHQPLLPQVVPSHFVSSANANNIIYSFLSMLRTGS